MTYQIDWDVILALNLSHPAANLELKGMFSAYELEGQDWLTKLPREEQLNFAAIGRMYAQHGVLGGKARAQTALRDERGRFISNDLDNGR